MQMTIQRLPGLKCPTPIGWQEKCQWTYTIRIYFCKMLGQFSSSKAGQGILVPDKWMAKDSGFDIIQISSSQEDRADVCVFECSDCVVCACNVKASWVEDWSITALFMLCFTWHIWCGLVGRLEKNRRNICSVVQRYIYKKRC